MLGAQRAGTARTLKEGWMMNELSVPSPEDEAA